jgi:RNA polymerase sigma factor (sigma-70 family)
MNGPTSRPDKPEALADFGEDDLSRWDNVARRYRVALGGFFANRVRNAADVDDLVQEVFVQLIRRGRGEPIEHIEQYLFQVAANVLRDHGRRRLVRHQDEHYSFDEDIHIFATEISPERVLLGEESLARFENALEQLPERTRDIFLLRSMERCKFADIARMLGVSKSTVEKEMVKAMMHLDRVLNSH